MKKYIIIDKQFPYGGGWWTWTKDEPLTKDEVLDLFRQYADNDGIELPEGGLYFDFIQDLWECEIVEYKKGE